MRHICVNLALGTSVLLNCISCFECFLDCFKYVHATMLHVQLFYFFLNNGQQSEQLALLVDGVAQWLGRRL